jgi:hypothetical protein
MSELLSTAQNKEWDKLVVRRPPGSCLVTPAHIARAVGLCDSAESMLQILNRHGTAHARPNPRRIHRARRRASPNGPIIGLHAGNAA